jgi:hypothetical protein
VIRGIAARFTDQLSLPVERTVHQWNQNIREHLRGETGLRLGSVEAQRSVPVRVVAGLPPPFTAIIARHPDPVEWELHLLRGTLAAAGHGLKSLDGRYPEIVPLALKGDQSLASQHEVARTHRLVDSLLHWLDRSDVPSEVFDIDYDVLGAYFIHRHEVQLYWMVIALVAGMLRQPTEALAIVVLAHELAHAYTHLGHDIDKRQWDTAAFAGADARIAEGLAQHYTRVICEERLHERLPAAGEAYRSLVACQRGAYRVHESWGGAGRVAGEAVRLAMLTTRVRKTTKYEDFRDHLDRSRAAVK